MILSNQFELRISAAAVVSLSFNDTTNALSLTGQNSVDLSSLLLSEVQELELH